MDTKMNYNLFLNITKLIDDNIVCLYQYGSRVYLTHHEQSDYDFICIVKNKTEDQFSKDIININFYTVEEHQDRINEHEISALETLFLDQKFVLKQEQFFNFELNLKKLRHSLSAKSSNSFVKCKKKLTVEQDLDIKVGIKSMFHAFRIMDFGIQIAEYGKIKDYTSSNHLYKNLVLYNDWTKVFEKYKMLYNNKLTEFRKIAPK